MNLVSWLAASILIGALLSLVTPSRFNVGALGSMGMSALGGVTFGFISTIFDFAAELQFDFKSLIAAVIGAVGAWIVMVAWIAIAKPSLHD